METFVGGTLRGVIDHLDYVASLGVTAIWLTPIFKVGSYHGYDTIDYTEIDPRFGAKADLAELVEQAHVRGLRVILDFVANHSSHQFEFFQQALADPASAHRELYDFDPAYQHGYRTFFADATMPQFNHDHPEARGYLLELSALLAAGVRRRRLSSGLRRRPQSRLLERLRRSVQGGQPRLLDVRRGDVGQRGAAHLHRPA